jgi:hypothetical protein
MFKYIITLTLAFILFSCNNNTDELKDSFGFFDISKNDNKVVFSYLKRGVGSSIYEMNIDGTEVKEIISTSDTKNYFRPVYSLDGEKILFLEYDKINLENVIICLADVDGSNMQRLTEGSESIITAIFSEYSDEIIYVKANEYGKSSPIAKEQAKGMDIYTVNILTKEVKKITDLNAYGIWHLFEMDSLTLLTHMAGPEGGMCLIDKEEPTKYNRIVPKNNPRKNASLYYTSVYSEKYNLMVFEAPYELYTMDMESKIAKSLFYSEGHHIKFITLYNLKPSVLFVIDGELKLSSINLDGTGFKKIKPIW